MVKSISTIQPQTGYVLEDENFSSVSLIFYEKNGKSFIPDVLETYNKSVFLDIDDEADLRNLLKDYVPSDEIIYIREDISHLYFGS